jgi:putative intracellular protease/amidase
MVLSKNKTIHKIRVAIFAEEPLGWGSGKHYFPIILDNYTWSFKNKSYKFTTKYIYTKDIVKGKLTTSNFDVLLFPGGGVGDGQSIMKGFTFFHRVRKWKKTISSFILNGGGYVGICGGTALITGLKTGNKKPRTFLERQYNKSSLGVSCVSSYYKTFAFPLFYPFQKQHPDKIGAAAYVFSFAPGETVDGVRIHTGGIPLDFTLHTDHPIFSDCTQNTARIRWWGGPALIIPEKPDRDVKILATYPADNLSQNNSIGIHAWKYTGGIRGLFLAFLKALKLIKMEKDTLKHVFLYTFYMAGTWEITNKKIKLDHSNRPSITAEIYPNKNKGRILLCTSHPQYMVWWDGHIEEKKTTDVTCLATGLYKWKDITPLSKTIKDELTHNWWMVRRFVAWAAKVPDTHLPPIQTREITKKDKQIISENIFWNGTLLNQMKNI